jgi:hypothetical protein
MLINRKLSVGPSTLHKFGLFSNEYIANGDIITQSPAIVFPIGVEYPNLLQKYMWAFNGKMMIALNYLSYINSSDDPVAIASYCDDREIITITAVTDIQPYEEITLKYL